MPISVYAPSITLSVTTSSQSAALPAGNSNGIRVVNSGTGLAYVVTGTGTVTATATNAPIGPNSTDVFECKEDDTAIGYIGAASSTISVSRCNSRQS